MDPIDFKAVFNMAALKKAGEYFNLAGIGYKVYGIGRDVVKEDGNFVERNLDDGSLQLGHKGERLIGSTVTATPGLVWSGVNAYRFLAGTNAVVNATTATTTLATAAEATTVTAVAGESVFLSTATVVTGEAALGTTGAIITGEGALVTTGLVATGETAVAAAAGETLLATSAVAGGEVAAGAGIGTAVVGFVAPIIVIGAATYVTGKAVNTIIDTRRTYESIDEMRRQMTAPGKFRDSGQPALLDYKQCLFSSCRFSGQMDGKYMTGKVERGDDGRITNLDTIDFTDNNNLSEFRRMLSDQIAHQQKIIADNSSAWPHWLRSDDGVGKQEMAKTDLAMLKNAQYETRLFENEFVGIKADGIYRETMKLREAGAVTLTRRLAEAHGSLPASRAALTEFLRIEDAAQEMARQLPPGSRRDQLMKESYMNCASVLASRASATENPREAMKDMQDAKEYLRRAGLDPETGRPREYTGMGTAFNWQLDPFGGPEADFLGQLRLKPQTRQSLFTNINDREALFPSKYGFGDAPQISPQTLQIVRALQQPKTVKVTSQK